MNQAKLVFFAHPSSLHIRSIAKYTEMLVRGMTAKGYEVETWSPQRWISRLPVPGLLQKWTGYLDQYLLFPFVVRHRIKKYPANTLFVFTDNAQGPWVPLVAKRKHVVHCHDFLAQRSANGEFPENKTGMTGRQYQAYIRRGLKKAQNFISVSQKTKSDLHQLLPFSPALSKVVYNGFNQKFISCSAIEARLILGNRTGINLTSGYFLHIGGNTWYKNRCGVIELYTAYRAKNGVCLPLLLIGEPPSALLQEARERSPYKDEIFFLSGMEDNYLAVAYAGALVFLFPSLAEGFGWPIAEAMVLGCPVITTKEAPMTEIGSDAVFYIDRRPYDNVKALQWASDGAEVIRKVLALSPEKRKKVAENGCRNAQRFSAESALAQISDIYSTILQQ